MSISEHTRRYLKFFMIMVMFLTVAAGTRASAQNMIKEAKHNKVTSATLITKKNRTRLKLKSGKYVKNTWVSYKGNIYYFNKSGYAKEGFFSYKSKRYYADKQGVVAHNQWIVKGSSYYYFKKNGEKAKGETLTIDGGTYVFKKGGKLDEDKSDAVKGLSDEVLFAGDSRTVGMSMSVSNEHTSYIGKVSQGYAWLAAEADGKVRQYLAKNPTANVIFCFGVNDLGYVNQYITYYKNIIKAYPKACFWFMSVNPISRTATSYLSNALIEAFNKQLKRAFGNQYIDTYSYLVKNGFSSFDGVHYTVETYQRIYAYTMNQIK